VPVGGTHNAHAENRPRARETAYRSTPLAPVGDPALTYRTTDRRRALSRAPAIAISCAPLCPQTHPTGPGSLSDRSTRQTPQSLDRRALVGSCACGAATPSRTGRPARPAADTHDQASSQRPCPPAEGSPTDGPAKPSRSDERALARYARSKPPHPGPRGRAHHRLVGPATHSGRTSPPPTVANPARRSPPVDSPMVAGLREVSPSPRRRGPRDGLRPLLAPPPRSVPSPPPADA
jgi:hypothetical protein